MVEFNANFYYVIRLFNDKYVYNMLWKERCIDLIIWSCRYFWFDMFTGRDFICNFWLSLAWANSASGLLCWRWKLSLRMGLGVMILFQFKPLHLVRAAQGFRSCPTFLMVCFELNRSRKPMLPIPVVELAVVRWCSQRNTLCSSSSCRSQIFIFWAAVAFHLQVR